jgi:hypothetical protein
VLDAVRDNTFHYPSPNKRYNPTSDQKLRDALAALGHIGVHAVYDGDTDAFTYNYADEAAFNLAMGNPSTSNEEAFRRSEVARDGPTSFLAWTHALIETYVKITGANFGEAVITDKEP